MAWLPLCVALLVLVALTTHPGITADAAGQADSAAIWLMCWAMAAGFARGLGFVPRHWPSRWLVSAHASLIALLLALLRLDAAGNPLLTQ